METVNVEHADGVVIVRLNRPPVNAVSKLMMRELRTTFDTISQDRTVGAAILAGAGERAFCGGIDMKEMAAGAAPDDEDGDLRAVLDPHWEWRRTQYSIRECLVPVIGAIERSAIGAGFGLAGVCDLVIAGEEATFGLTEINRSPRRRQQGASTPRTVQGATDALPRRDDPRRRALPARRH